MGCSASVSAAGQPVAGVEGKPNDPTSATAESPQPAAEKRERSEDAAGPGSCAQPARQGPPVLERALTFGIGMEKAEVDSPTVLATNLRKKKREETEEGPCIPTIVDEEDADEDHAPPPHKAGTTGRGSADAMRGTSPQQQQRQPAAHAHAEDEEEDEDLVTPMRPAASAHSPNDKRLKGNTGGAGAAGPGPGSTAAPGALQQQQQQQLSPVPPLPPIATKSPTLLPSMSMPLNESNDFSRLAPPGMLKQALLMGINEADERPSGALHLPPLAPSSPSPSPIPSANRYDDITLSDDEDEDDAHGFDLDRWHRYYKWNKTKHADLLEFLWRRFDPKTYSIFCASFKFQDLMFAGYQGDNLIHGMCCRMERLKVDLFGIMHTLYASNTDSYKVVGVFIVKGSELPAELSTLPDFEHYQFLKADSKDPTVRKFIGALITGVAPTQPPGLSVFCSQEVHTAGSRGARGPGGAR